MKNLTFSVLILVVLSCNDWKNIDVSLQNQENKNAVKNYIIVGSDVLGVIEGKIIKFYIYSNGNWRIGQISNFKIPSNNGIISTERGTIGVINRNKIRFYKLNEGSWKLLPDLDFSIPNNDGIFSAGIGIIGVINGNKIQFYQSTVYYLRDPIRLQMNLSSY